MSSLYVFKFLYDSSLSARILFQEGLPTGSMNIVYELAHRPYKTNLTLAAKLWTLNHKMFIFRVAPTKEQHPVLDFVVIGFTLHYGPSLCQIHTLASRFIPTGLYTLLIRINELYYNNFLLCRL